MKHAKKAIFLKHAKDGSMPSSWSKLARRACEHVKHAKHASTPGTWARQARKASKARPLADSKLSSGGVVFNLIPIKFYKNHSAVELK